MKRNKLLDCELNERCCDAFTCDGRFVYSRFPRYKLSAPFVQVRLYIYALPFYMGYDIIAKDVPDPSRYNHSFINDQVLSL
jgi:hypothetical protein